MEGKKPLRYRRCLLVGQSENALPPAQAYASSCCSSTATSIVVSLAAIGSPTVTSCLTLGTYLGNGDLFLLLCRISLVGARVFLAMDFM